MPYHIKKNKDGCYQVMNKESGKVHSFCTTKEKAEAQVRVLKSFEKK
jgi:ribosomal protein S6